MNWWTFYYPNHFIKILSENPQIIKNEQMLTVDIDGTSAVSVQSEILTSSLGNEEKEAVKNMINDVISKLLETS